MKPDQMYQELKDLAEKLGVAVEEHNFRATAVGARSGLCTVHGKQRFVMDKHKSIHKKIAILAAAIAKLPTEDVFIVPAVRALLDKHADEEDA
jgi:ABC-type enterochelin transport system substrate-binding protein